MHKECCSCSTVVDTVLELARAMSSVGASYLRFALNFGGGGGGSHGGLTEQQ
jgi:hypothetical protein